MVLFAITDFLHHDISIMRKLIAGLQSDSTHNLALKGHRLFNDALNLDSPTLFTIAADTQDYELAEAAHVLNVDPNKGWPLLTAIKNEDMRMAIMLYAFNANPDLIPERLLPGA